MSSKINNREQDTGFRKNHELFDVIVVGGGPAGSAAACTLAAGGISVCLIDKAVFPREKLCGGLLTLRSKKLYEQIFGNGWEEVVVQKSRGAGFWYQDTLLNTVQDYQEVALTQRYLFDDILIRKAEQSGTILRLGTSVAAIDTTRSLVVLADGSALEYRCLLGCDGVYSIVGKTLFGKAFDKSKTCFALEVELPLSMVDYQISDPEICFGYVNWGYGWIFPKQDFITVGLAGIHSKNKDIVAGFKQFLAGKFGFIPDVKFNGHYLPFGEYRKQPGKENILLCGDAAGLVDPITGEGIAYALESGFLAAKAVQKAMSYNSPQLALHYYNISYQKLVSSIRLANKLKYLIFPHLTHRWFIRALPQTQSIPYAYFDILAGEMSYQQLMGFMLRKLLKRIITKGKI